MSQRSHGCLFSVCSPLSNSAKLDGQDLEVSPSNDEDEKRLEQAASTCSTTADTFKSKSTSLLTDGTTTTDNSRSVEEARARSPCRLPALPTVLSRHMVGAKSSPCKTPVTSQVQAGVSKESTPMRRRDAFRSAGRTFTARLTRRFTSIQASLYRKQSTLVTASSRVPLPSCPTVPALATHHLEKVSVNSIRAALERIDNCPLLCFMSKAASCYDFVSSAWEDCKVHPGSQVRKCIYMTPVPPDIPAFAKRMLNVPDKLSGCTVWRMKGDSQELFLLQHSYTRDVLYGDRFKVQSMIHFSENASGVTVRQWIEIVWEKPLPWTHGVVRHFIDAKARQDGMDSAGVMVQCFKDAVAALDES